MTGQAISKANFMIHVFVFRFERESWLSWKVVASGTGMKSWQGCFDIFSSSFNFFLQIYLSKLQISFGCQDKSLTKGVACLLYSVWLPVYYTVCDCLSQIKSEVWNVSFLYLSCTSKCRLVPIDTLVWLLSGLSLSGQSGTFFAQGDCFRGRLESKRVLPTLFLDPPTHPPGSIWTWIGIELTWISLRILKSYI